MYINFGSGLRLLVLLILTIANSKGDPVRSRPIQKGDDTMKEKETVCPCATSGWYHITTISLDIIGHLYIVMRMQRVPDRAGV